jgi:pimeloyl-ACP methyl ester carboxylesterase
MTTATVEIDAVPWAYQEAGAGPLLLLFHGTLSSRRVFTKQIEGLSPQHRVVAVDWPGHGDSGYNPDGWTVSQLTEAVPQLIDALGEQAAVLAGVSQGGAISMRVALRYPDRVDALITMSAGPDRPGDQAIAMMARLGDVLATGIDDERRAALQQAQRDAFHAKGWVDSHPEAAEAELQTMLAHSRAAMPHATHIPATYDSIESRLGAINCPTLIIWGEEDVRASWGPRMAELMPNAQLLTVPGAGHHVTLDAPDVVGAAMSEFLARLPQHDRPRTEAEA